LPACSQRRESGARNASLTGRLASKLLLDMRRSYFARWLGLGLAKNFALERTCYLRIVDTARGAVAFLLFLLPKPSVEAEQRQQVVPRAPTFGFELLDSQGNNGPASEKRGSRGGPQFGVAMKTIAACLLLDPLLIAPVPQPCPPRGRLSRDPRSRSSLRCATFWRGDNNGLALNSSFAPVAVRGARIE
jgi:hypothetical protein